MASARKLTILFVPLDGYGHVNACVGVAEQLTARGHRVVFALERAWRGKASRYSGIEEIIYVDKTRDPNLAANEYWTNFMQEFRKKFHLEPLEALKLVDLELEWDFMNALLNCDAELTDIIQKIRPDVIVADTYVSIPAVYKSGIPWVWLTSAGPLAALPSNELPPHRTGYPLNSDRSKWEEYSKVAEQQYGPMAIRFVAKLIDEFGLPPPPPGEVMHPSPYLNVYAYPEELDKAYLDIRPLPDKTWQRFDHFIRTSDPDPDFKIPDEFLRGAGKLVYLSMGSMASADVDLMKRLVTILAKSPHRFIVSLGTSEAELKPILPANMWGSFFVPQVNVLPLVDLVITHGGNNTLIESLYFGKPLLITPLFGDQYDNAQRVTEEALGARLNPYHCTSEELLNKVDQLLNDTELHQRVKKLSERLQASKSTEKLAVAIESLAK